VSGRSDPSSASHHNPSGQGSSSAGSTSTPDDREPDAAGPDPTAPGNAPALGNAAAAFIAAGRDAAPRRENPAFAAGRTAPEADTDGPPALESADEPPTQHTEAVAREVELRADRSAAASGLPGPAAEVADSGPGALGSGAEIAGPQAEALDSASKARGPASDIPRPAPAERGSLPDAPGPGLEAPVPASQTRAPAPQVGDSAPDASDPAPEARPGEEPQASGFHLRLSNFQGPFDLLLTLISSRKLDVTEVALHKVTDEFIAYTKALTASMARQNTLRADKILDQTTEFLVVAATLLDLKAARLLPSGEMTDAEDLELLEARDLLFARLLQYRAFKQVAELLGELEAAALRRYPRAVGLEERYAGLLPEVRLGVGAAEFAEIAAAAFRPRPVPKVGLDHLHTHAISVAEQAALVLERLKQRGAGAWTSFGELVADCELPVQIVARFLALLELYRGKTIEFDQPDPLGPLAVSWIGDEAAQQTDTVTIEEDYG
jgi:segregation and condensation protein A